MCVTPFILQLFTSQKLLFVIIITVSWVFFCRFSV